MKCKRSELIALFEQLEYKTASKWSKARLLGKIKGLPDVVDDDTDAGDHQDFLDDLLDAVAKEEDVEIDDDVAKKTAKGAASKSTKTAKGAKGPKADKADAPKREKVERDKFGSKIGTQCNLINEVMTAKEQDTKTIAEASGLPTSRVKAHMTYLVGKGFVEKGDKGYKLTKDAPKK